MARTSISSLPALLTAPSSFLVYGTAWKKDKTATLVTQALKAGFRVIDTAAQPKHYREDLVGDAIRAVLAEGVLKREDIYVKPPMLHPLRSDFPTSPLKISPERKFINPSMDIEIDIPDSSTPNSRLPLAKTHTICPTRSQTPSHSKSTPQSPPPSPISGPHPPHPQFQPPTSTACSCTRHWKQPISPSSHGASSNPSSRPASAHSESPTSISPPCAPCSPPQASSPPWFRTAFTAQRATMWLCGIFVARMGLSIRRFGL